MKKARTPRTPLPKRPYRATAILYGSFAVVFAVVVAATGGALLPRIDHRVGHDRHFVIGALPVAAGCFLLATAYSWWRIRQRLEAKERDS